MQQLQNGEADAVGAVVIALRPAADQNVEAFGRDGLVEGLFALLSAKVRKQIVDDELRVAGVAADGHKDLAAVAADDLAVQLQRTVTH